MRAAAEGETALNDHSNRNGWIRQAHRGLSMAFTLTVIANFVAMKWRGGPRRAAG